MDAYDPIVAFDDIYDDTPAPRDITSVAGAVLEHVARKRIRMPLAVAPAPSDPTHLTFEILGADDEETGLPIFDSLARKFSQAVPDGQLVRLDDEDSYRQFRTARREPYLAQLEQRLNALEQAFHEHVSDQHGGALSHVIGAVALEAAHGGQPIVLPLRACSEGVILCWQDGDEILCTIRVKAPDGTLCLATTGGALEPHLESVIGSACVIGAEPEDIVQVAPGLAQMVGADVQLGRLCRVVGQLLEHEAPFVGVLSCDRDPKVAAAMALLQHCQMGNRKAVREALQLPVELVKHASECLAIAQRSKS